MLLQLYTNLNLELVHHHERQLNLLFIVKKTVVCSPLFEGSAEGQGVGWRGRGVGVPTEDRSRKEGGRICHRAAAANPSPSPCLRSGAPSPALTRGATDETNRSSPRKEGSRPFFPSQVFFPSPQPPVGWAYTVFNF
jgi:hypothetical protein